MNASSKKRSGFTLVEILIALAVLGLILAAVAMAFDAAAHNYRQNTGMYETMAAGRQAMGRMTTLIRTGQVSPANEGSAQCSLITAGSDDITLRFDSSAGKIFLDDNSANSSYLLCENVSAASFSKTLAGDAGAEYVTSVVISMTLTVNDVSQTLSSAAVLRRNL